MSFYNDAINNDHQTAYQYILQGRALSEADTLRGRLDLAGEDRDIPYRIATACLLSSDEELHQVINEWILTRSALTKNSFTEPLYDDFSITAITRMVLQCQNLSEEARAHAIDHLLKLEGENPQTGLPLFWGHFRIGRNSENHELMILSAQFFKNRLAGIDNRQVEAKLLWTLQDILNLGLREYNSIPYIGYTVSALLNIYDFGSDEMKALAKEILDKIFTDYMLSSCDYKIFPDFSRQARKVQNDALYSDNSLEPFLRVWNNDPLSSVLERHSKRIADAIHTSYRPPILDLQEGVYVAKRRNNSLWQAVAEIVIKAVYAIFGWPDPGPISYSLFGGFFVAARKNFYIPQESGKSEKSSFVLTGGTTTSSWSHFWPQEQVSRPPIFLSQSSKQTVLTDTAYIANRSEKPGLEAQKRNNSCIDDCFMAAQAPIQLPEDAEILAGNLTDGAIVELQLGVRAFVKSSSECSLMALFPNLDPDKTLQEWQEEDCDALLQTILSNNDEMKNCFVFPDSQRRVEFDIHAPRHLWAITSRGQARDAKNWSCWLEKMEIDEEQI